MTAEVAKTKLSVSISGGLTKQDVILADATGVSTLTLGKTDMDSVADDLFYKLSNIVVHEYQRRKYSSLPKKDAFIADIGKVCDDDFDFEEDTLTVHRDEVIGVLNLKLFRRALYAKLKWKQQQQTGYVQM